MKNLAEAIKRLSDYKSNDKSGLFYMLRHVNHSKYFYTYEQSYTRKEILSLLIAEVSTERGYNKLLELQPYRDLKEIANPNKLNYEKLVALEPTIYDTLTNSLGQIIELVEHPTKGDTTQVIAVCHTLKLAYYTDFFDLDDMLAEHKEYEPIFINGEFQHGI